MRPLGLGITLVTLLVSAPTNGVAQTGLGGSWDFVIMSESGEPQVRMRVEFTVTQDGRLRGGTDRPSRSEMTGSVVGSKVRLFWDTTYEGTPVDLRFTGTVTADGMSGSVVINFGGSISQSTWTAIRAEPLE